MTLHLRTLTWSYVDLRDPWGRRVQLNLHGLALAHDNNGDPNTAAVFVFGGKVGVLSKHLAPMSSLSSPYLIPI